MLLPGAGAPLPLTLVRPEDANVDCARLSMLSDVGLALIGLAVGAVARVPLASGRSVGAKALGTRPGDARVHSPMTFPGW